MRINLFEEQVIDGKMTFLNFTPATTFYSKDQLRYERRYIYAFRCDRFIKIGQSIDVAKRMEALQRSNPFEIQHIGKRRVPIRAVTYAEAWAHSQMGTPIRGEWFDGNGKSDSEIRQILGEAFKRGRVYDRLCSHPTPSACVQGGAL